MAECQISQSFDRLGEILAACDPDGYPSAPALEALADQLRTSAREGGPAECQVLARAVHIFASLRRFNQMGAALFAMGVADELIRSIDRTLEWYAPTPTPAPEARAPRSKVAGGTAAKAVGPAAAARKA